MALLHAPWAPEIVEWLNTTQQDGKFHPYTCKNRNDGKHDRARDGVLVATINGWICPYCDYKQDWCHKPLFTRPSSDSREDA